jgi:hypothetical protein
MEVEALLGMRQVVERSPNLVIVVEWSYHINSHRNEQKTIRCINWLTELGYKFYQYLLVGKNSCQIGKFWLFEEPLTLLRTPPFDLFAIPAHIDPNK